MADHILQIADDFWNVRGSFRLFGLVDIGTQSSLVRLASGRFVLLDSYLPKESVLHEILELTDGGAALDAVLNLHPFHTLHVEAVHARFPGATLYGTRRHVAKAPHLPWAPERVEDRLLHDRFAADLDFMVPDGVVFIADDERIHFSSVLAFHRASKTLHVDDTLTFAKLPLMSGKLVFHPTLSRVLREESGAAAAFRAWAQALAERCDAVDQVCTAHMRPLPSVGAAFGEEVRRALGDVEAILARHEARWG